MWAMKGRRFYDVCLLTKPSCFLTPMGKSYLGLVEAQVKFKMLIFTIKHVWEEGGWVVWAVKNIYFFCLVLGPEEIFYSIFASIGERRSIRVYVYECYKHGCRENVLTKSKRYEPVSSHPRIFLVFLYFREIYFYSGTQQLTITVIHLEINTFISSKCWKLCLKDDLNHRFCDREGRFKMPGEPNCVFKYYAVCDVIIGQK